MPGYFRFLAALACLMGAAGVALAAVSSHAGGGDLGKTASEFLILHAGALLGLCAHSRAASSSWLRWGGFAAGGLALGTLLFSGDLAMRAFEGAKLFPMAAPTGGSLMILSWLALAASFAFTNANNRPNI